MIFRDMQETTLYIVHNPRNNSFFHDNEHSRTSRITLLTLLIGVRHQAKKLLVDAMKESKEAGRNIQW